MSNYYKQSFNHLKQLYKLDDEKITNFLGNTVVNLKKDVQSLQNAMGDNDLGKLQKIGHSLKGALVNLGLQDLSEQAKNIEQTTLLDTDSENIVRNFVQQIGLIKDEQS
jgi:histidine phosphotransfer protein HptB